MDGSSLDRILGTSLVLIFGVSGDRIFGTAIPSRLRSAGSSPYRALTSSDVTRLAASTDFVVLWPVERLWFIASVGSSNSSGQFAHLYFTAGCASISSRM